MQDLQQAIRDEAARLGFVSCGFARADATPEAGRHWPAVHRSFAGEEARMLISLAVLAIGVRFGRFFKRKRAPYP